MKSIKFLSALAVTTIPLTLTVTGCGVKDQKDVYRNIDMDKNWSFKLNDTQTASIINLPHDFSIIQDFVQPTGDWTVSSGTTGFLPGGIGHYEKSFYLEKIDEQDSYILNFDGAYNNTEVKVNDTVIGNNQYGYNPFAFDITDYVKVGDNKIEVTVKHEYITSSRWYPGSGIYRDVKLSIIDKVHVAHNGTYVTTPNLKQEVGKNVTLKVDVDVDNNYDLDKKVYVRNRLVDKNGAAVTNWTNSSSITIPKHNTKKFKTTLKVNNPKLWSAEDPNLYYVETQVVRDRTIVDQYKTRFGFRYYEFNDRGFWVNGKSTKLHGVCLHHDQGALGAAAYDDAIYRQLTIMKEMGMNAIRTSHNCPDEDFLRMCDELGFYVSDEAFDTWEFAKTDHDSSYIFKRPLNQSNLIDGKPEMEWNEYVMRSMVKRDRNCPSIFMWSLGNELHEGDWHDPIPQEEKDEIEREMLGYANKLLNIANELDYDPTTQRWSGIALERNPNPGSVDEDIPKCKIGKMLYEKGGVMGFNYGSADQTLVALGLYDRVYGSETASARNSRGMYAALQEEGPDGILHDGNYHITSYDGSGSAMASEVLWRTLAFDGYAGQFIWTGFDYIGEPSPWCYNVEDDPISYVKSWPFPNSSYYGIVDTAGFAKDSFYLYRSHLRHDDTTLHLVGSLNENNMFKYTNEEGFPVGYTPFDIYTNAPFVLIKDGNTTLAKITQIKTKTTKKWSTYDTYKAEVVPDAETICQIKDSQIMDQSGHDLYSRVLIDPTKISEVTAHAYKDEACTNEITNTVGLKHIVPKDDSSTSIECRANRETIKADGKSLSYITVDLLDKNKNLITNLTSQVPLNISWSGKGKVLGVDNGDQSTIQKWQNPNIFHPDLKTATIMTYAGKALIIVCSDYEPGEINVSINDQIVSIKTN